MLEMKRREVTRTESLSKRLLPTMGTVLNIPLSNLIIYRWSLI